MLRREAKVNATIPLSACPRCANWGYFFVGEDELRFGCPEELFRKCPYNDHVWLVEEVTEKCEESAKST